jgi:5-methylcytosine-specific restriction endonuclease McrA
VSRPTNPDTHVNALARRRAKYAAEVGRPVGPYNRVKDGRKKCRDCGQEKPIEDFSLVHGQRHHDSRCLPCLRAYKAAWARAHSASRKPQPYTAERAAYARERYKAKRELILAQQRAARLRRSDPYAAQYKWGRNHAEEQAQFARVRRARKQAAAGECSLQARMARIAYYGERCYLCGAPYEQMDHVIPLSRGGSEWPANQRPVCARCNFRKNDRLLRELVAV